MEMGSELRNLAIMAAMYLALIVGASVLLVVQSQPTGYDPAPAEWPDISDRPLLTAEQMAEARETGTAAFDCAGKHWVVEGIPDEYIERTTYERGR